MTRDEAKAFAHDILAPFEADGGGLQFSPSHNPDAEIYWREIGFRMFKRAPLGTPGWEGFSVQVDRLHWLIVQAAHSPVAFEVLEELVRRYLRFGEAMPPPIANYVIRRLDGVTERPRRHGQSKSKKYWRDYYCALLVAMLSDQGFEIGRNETAQTCDSASDIVAEVFAEAGEKLVDYRIVRKAYYRYRNLV